MDSDAGTCLNITDKFKTILNELLRQNYCVMNDVYLNMFIIHVSGKHGEGEKFDRLPEFFLNNTYTVDWTV